MKYLATIFGTACLFVSSVSFAALDTTAALAELASADVSVQAIFGGMIVVIALMFVISKVRSLLKA